MGILHADYPCGCLIKYVARALVVSHIGLSDLVCFSHCNSTTETLLFQLRSTVLVSNGAPLWIWQDRHMQNSSNASLLLKHLKDFSSTQKICSLMRSHLRPQWTRSQRRTTFCQGSTRHRAVRLLQLSGRVPQVRSDAPQGSGCHRPQVPAQGELAARN